VLTSRQPYPVPAQHPTDQTYALSLHDALPIWSDFIEARYAFSFVLANFGIAIAAKMPMITTTISSSMRVKPLRFICTSPCFRGRIAKSVTWSYGILHRTPRSKPCAPRGDLLDNIVWGSSLCHRGAGI